MSLIFEYTHLRCCECGQFIADTSAFYGASCDVEPPDEDYYCPRCAAKNMPFARAYPERVVIGCFWVKPDYVSVAKSILRHQRKMLHEN